MCILSAGAALWLAILIVAIIAHKQARRTEMVLPLSAKAPATMPAAALVAPMPYYPPPSPLGNQLHANGACPPAVGTWPQ